MEPNNLSNLTELWKWNEIWKVYKFSNCFYEASVSHIQILKFQLYEPLQVAGLISTWLQASAGADGFSLIVVIRLPLHIHTGMALVQHVTSLKEMGL